MLVRAMIKNNDGTEDWDFGRGYGSYRTNQSAIEQDIYTALNEWQNDCFFALDSGIDWQTRLGYKNQKALLDVDIQDLVSNRTGVILLDNFTSTLEGRYYYCSMDVYTIYSTEAINLTYSNNGEA
jgi:hypothetical protein